VSSWIEPPPAELSTAVSEAFRRVQRADVDAQLRPLVEPLRDAYAAKDYQQCSAIIARWKAIMESAEVTTCAADLTQEVQPVIEWIRREDELAAHRRRFERACEAVVKLLDSDANDTDLEAALARAGQFGEVIPADLQQRYEARRAQHDKAQGRAHRFRLIMIAAAVFVLLALSVPVYYLTTQSSNAKRWGINISAAVNKARTNIAELDAARKIADDQQKTAPNLSNTPEVKAAREALEALVQERERQERQLGETTRMLADAIAAAKTADGDAALSPASLFAAASDSGKALAGSQVDLSWVDVGNTLGGLRKELGDIQSRLAGKANSYVLGELARLDGEVLAVTVPAGTDLETIDKAKTKIEDLFGQINKLNVPGIDEKAKSQITRLLAGLSDKRKAAENAFQFATALQDVKDASDSADRLRSALEKFMEQFPDSDTAGEFRMALQAIPTAKSMEAYRNTLRPWMKDGGTRLAMFFPASVGAAGAAQTRLDDIAKYLKDNPASPVTRPLNEYSDYFRRMLEALGEKSSWQSGYGDMLANPLLCELSYIETSAHRKFFVLTPPQIVVGGVNNERVQTVKVMNPAKPADVKIVEVRAPETILDNGKPKYTPHAQFVKDLDLQLKQIRAASWETFGIDTIDKLNESKDIDPTVRGMLVTHTLQSQQAVLGPLAAEAYDDAAAALKRLKLDEIIFYDPDRPVPESTLAAIKSALALLPKADAGRKYVADKKETMIKDLLFVPLATGVLLRDAKGYRVETRGGNQDGNIALAVQAPPQAAPPAVAPPPAATGAAPATAAADPGPLLSANPGSLVKMAVYKGGKWILANDTPHDLPAGTMLFIVAP
jgi:hypothetical protein